MNFNYTDFPEDPYISFPVEDFLPLEDQPSNPVNQEQLNAADTLEFKVYELTAQTSVQVATALTSNPSLTALSLPIEDLIDRMTVDDRKNLADAFDKNTTLQTLTVNANNIGREGSKLLREILKSGSITTLNLSGIKISDPRHEIVKTALLANTTLTTLSLDSRAPDLSSLFEGAIPRQEKVTPLIRAMTNLTSLTVMTSSLNSEEIQETVETIKTNTNLTALSLSSNSISDEDGIAIAEALNINTTITAINLSQNSLANRAAIAFADTLRVNTTLTRLEMLMNNIGEDGVEHLISSLAVNKTLRSLNISYNLVSDLSAEMSVIAQAIENNPSITDLQLTTAFGHVGTGVDRINAILEMNTLNTENREIDLYTLLLRALNNNLDIDPNADVC